MEQQMASPPTGGVDRNEDTSSSDSEQSDVAEENENIAEVEARIDTLQQQLNEDVYQYDAHVECIQLLRQLGDLERVRIAREEMSRVFPLSEDHWLSWLQDEIPLASIEEACLSLKKLFDRAVEDYLSIQVWVLYCQFAVDKMEMFDEGVDFVRDIFERAVIACGQHVTKGCIIWDAYCEFETAILSSLQELQEPEEIDVALQEQIMAQHDKVNKLYRRQLAMPLQGMQDTFKEYQQWSDEDVVMETSLPQYTTALNMLDKLLPCETSLGQPGSVEAYQSYLAIVKGDKLLSNPTRITNLYQRAVADNCLHDNLWIEYTNYVVEQKMSQSIISVYRQAVRNCPWSCDLWIGYCRALERSNSNHQIIIETFNQSLEGMITDPADCLRLWVAFCEYMRRRASLAASSSPAHPSTSPSHPSSSSGSNTSEVEELRSTFDRAREYMRTNFTKGSGDPNCTLPRYQARLEAGCYDNITKARLLWQEVMKARGRHANYWLEYANMERSYGDVTECRKVLQLGINSVTEDIDLLYDCLIQLEQDEGTLNSYEEAVGRIEAQKKRLAERSKDKGRDNKGHGKKPYKSQEERPRKEQQRAQQEFKEPRQPASQRSRKRPINTQVFFEEDDDKNKAEGGPTFKKPKKSYAATPTSREASQSNAAADSTKEVASEASSVAVEAAEKASNGISAERGVASGRSNTEFTAFVSNLPFNVSEDELREKFKHCGDIADIRLAQKHIRGRACKFAYVEFQSKDAARLALRLDRSELCGRAIFVSPCRKGVEGGSHDQPILQPQQRDDKTTVFVSKLPSHVTKETVEELFSQCGVVKEVRLVMRSADRCKGIGYVQYHNEEEAHKAVDQLHNYTLGNRTISVAMSNPPARGHHGNRPPPHPQARSPVEVAMDTSKPQATEPEAVDVRTRRSRSAILLVPRSVAKKPDNSTSSQNTENKETKPMSNDDFRKLLGK